MDKNTIGHYLAHRLIEIHVPYLFSNPCELNQTLLDHMLLAEPGLDLIKCPDELFPPYMANGYSGGGNLGAYVITFTNSRGLKVLNALSDAYTNNLPILCIVVGQGPDYVTKEFTHEQLSRVSCFQAAVNNLEDAHKVIDTAISTVLEKRKPVYITIGSNLLKLRHPSLAIAPKLSNKRDLEAAVAEAPEFLVNTEMVREVKKAKLVNPCR